NVGSFFLRRFVAITRDDKGWLVVLINLARKGAQTLVFGRGRERPVDLLVVRGAELDFVEAMLFVKCHFAFELQLGFLNFLQQLFEGLLFLEVRLLIESAFCENFDKAVVLEPAAELRGGGFVLLYVEQETRKAGALQRDALLSLHDVILGGALHELTGKIAFVADIAFALATLHAIERRLGDKDVTALDKLLHVAEKEGKQQGADVRAVDVRVGHENHFVVAELAGIEIVFADASAERGNDGANFLVAEHLVVAGFFDVEDLAFERQDGLVFAIAALLCGAAGGFPLNDEQFAARGVTFLAVGKFAGQAAGI